MSLKFTKSQRLKKSREFRSVQSRGREYKGRLLILCAFTHPQKKEPKLGVVASRYFGNAIQRNRFKRLSREAFRLSQKKFPKGAELVLKPRKYARKASMQEIQQELIELVSNIC